MLNGTPKEKRLLDSLLYAIEELKDFGSEDAVKELSLIFEQENKTSYDIKYAIEIFTGEAVLEVEENCGSTWYKTKDGWHFIQTGKCCDHDHKTYQPREPENNIGESYTCDDCGEELDIPEPDPDIYHKEQSIKGI